MEMNDEYGKNSNDCVCVKLATKRTELKKWNKKRRCNRENRSEKKKKI